MWVRFWGVRGSCPSPLRSEDIAARLQAAILHLGCDSDAPDLRDPVAVARWIDALPFAIRGTSGGNTPCVEMRTDSGDLFIIDLGSGLRPLGGALMETEFGKGQGHANIFLSHFHWDHIQGLPFFKPAYLAGNRFDVYTRHDNLEQRLHAQQEAPFFPAASWDDMRADVSYHQMSDEPLLLCDDRVRVTTIELDHPSRAWAYRFEADGKVFVYASDSAYHHLDKTSTQPFVDFYRDADLLVFDAQFTLAESFEKRTWGHSSAIVGVELACQAGVKNLALFHHDPGADEEMLESLLRVGEDYAEAVRCPGHCRLTLAREGLTLDL